MKSFTEWANKNIKESSLRDILKPVPQSPEHHPEGNVFRHTYMVRQALPKALELLHQESQNPNSAMYGMNFNLTKEEKNLLRVAAWLHDIGKSKATITSPEGKISSKRHEDPEYFEPAMQELGVKWKNMFEKAVQNDPSLKEDLWFVIENHMNLKRDSGFGSRILHRFLNPDGKYKHERKVKLLLVILLMDTMGRGGSANNTRTQAKLHTLSNLEDANNRIGLLNQSSKEMIKKSSYKAKEPAPNDPSEFVQAMSGKPKDVVLRAMKGKFPELSYDELLSYLKESTEYEEKYDVVHPEQFGDSSLPLPKDVHYEVKILNKLFKDAGYKLFIVGGIVRDYLFNKHHPEIPYKPKDVDLATDAIPEAVEEILKSEEAKHYNIKALPLGVAFGIWQAHFSDSKNEYEIATFREEKYDDPKSRKPTEVKFTTPGQDAKRRDLTINALFYDIDSKEIRDYNVDHFGQGKGFKDIKNKVANPGDDPRQRFQEDHLRILRLIRFFSKYNNDNIKKTLTQDALDAIEDFKHLPGISADRIRDEFLNGLNKSIHTASYLENFNEFDLLPILFPGLKVNTSNLENVGNSKNANSIIAYLLRNNDNVQQVEKHLKESLRYTKKDAESIVFLLCYYLYNHGRITLKDLLKIKFRNQIPVNDIMDFAWIAKLNEEFARKLATYEKQIKSLNDLAKYIDVEAIPKSQLSNTMLDQEVKLFMDKQ